MVWWNGDLQPNIELQQVNQFKETAVCESMHGGVRGRGSNPPTYSIARKSASITLATNLQQMVQSEYVDTPGYSPSVD